nr:hypothetical chloroplast RF1 [Oedogonium sp. 260-2_chl]
MSLVTVIKDYFEIIHKMIETSPAYVVQHATYTDSTTLYFYLINTLKNLVTDFFSPDFFQKIAAFPILVPSIADSMISEISVLDGTFHNLFTFLDAPIFSKSKDFIVIVCLEKFFIGLFNSLFLWLPTCAATFLCFRRFVMQGIEIGYIAAIGTMTANIFWLICVLFGVRCIVIPWMSLDILRYLLGFMLLIKYFWDNRLPAKEIKSEISINIIKTKFGLKSFFSIFTQSFQLNNTNPIKQVFFFHFLLAFTEQTTLYPFLSHFSLSAQSTYLESFPSNNFMNFLIINCFYLFGIFIGSFSFINFLCWFWEEPAYKVYLWTTKNFQKIRVGDMVRITHFIFQTLTILLACASLPYFSIEYFITKPLGFLPNDEIFHQSQNHAFLTHSTSPVLYRSPYYFPRQRFFRYDDWAEYYGKNIPLDTSLYDQGAYRLYPPEDLHFGADYEWTRRRSNHVKIRSRMKRIMWFPRNWATQIWDLAKTWSRRNVAWRNEILSQYQNNWDSKSAPFWEQIVREGLIFGKEKSKTETTNQSPWAASHNWSQKFLISGESLWWNWWAKNANSDNKIWWTWIVTKNKQIIRNNRNQLASEEDEQNLNKSKNEEYNNEKQGQIKQEMLFSNYQKIPSSYREDYWLPQERLISLYSEQNQRQKNQFIYEIATLRKLVRKINKRVQINSNVQHIPSRLYTIFFIQSLTTNFKNKFSSNQQLTNKNNEFMLNSNKTLNSLLHGYNLANQSYTFNKYNNIDKEKDTAGIYTTSRFDKLRLFSTNLINLESDSDILVNTNKKTQQRIVAPSSLFLTLPAHYYLHTEQSFSRKLEFYGVRTSREFKPLNNSPIFNYYMKTYFHQYKPTRLYIANTKMKRDLGAGGRNRFKSRQYANKQLKKARIISKTPWIRQWISQSGFLTRRKRLESWIRYSHYNSNEIWAFLLRIDIDNFIKRQPSSHLLTNNEERLLHLRRFLLGEHFETLRWYSYMQHYRSMKVKIGGTKSFLNRMYNQQFKGTFHKVRHLFALTPSLNGGGILTFDQLLYNEFSNDKSNTIFNKDLIHEELLSDKIKNLNSFLVKDKKTQNFNFNFYSNDLIIKFSDIIKDYLLEIMPSRQEFIKKLLKDKNFINLTNFLWSVRKDTGFNQNLLINQISKRKVVSLQSLDLQEKSMRPSFSIDQQKKYQSMLIFLFNKRRFLAKDYKRGSERLWKKWRKNFLIQKQIHKQNNIGRLLKDQHLIFSNNININPASLHQHPIEQKALSISRIDNNIQKNELYYKSISKYNEPNTAGFSYQKKATIRKALKDSISIQKNFFNQNNIAPNTVNFGFPLITQHFKKKIESYNQKEDTTKMNVETILNVTKDNLQSKLFSTDNSVIKELINKIYNKINIFQKIQLKHFILDYWFQNLININKKNWHLLYFNLERSRKTKNQNYILNKKNRQEEIFNVLSYLQNKTIRQRLNINKTILTLKNYNQIDSKLNIIRASRHLKRARISQRKKLSQPIQKYKNFFHIETENIDKLNVFNMYKTLDSLIIRFPDIYDFKGKISPTNYGLPKSSSILNLDLNSQTVATKMNNFIESYYINLRNEKKQKEISNTILFHNSNIFNNFQPFLESLYYLPRLSMLWQSNLINAKNKSKINMGSLYETKQYATPIGVHKQLFRQNFNTKNRSQDNIKRKLLDNHLNRFSERRRWNNQSQTINPEINEQVKKFFEQIKQNQNSVFKNKKTINKNRLFHRDIMKEIDLQSNKEYLHPNNDKQEFFSLQKSIQNLNIKEIDELLLLSSIIDQKNYQQSSINFSLLSFFDLMYLFNKFNKKSNVDFDQSQANNSIFSSKEIYNLDNWNGNFSNIKEFIINSDFNNKSMKGNLGSFNKEFLGQTQFNNFILNSYPEIKKEKLNGVNTQKKLFFTNRFAHYLQKKNNKKNIPNEGKQNYQTYQVSKSVKYYLIETMQQTLEKQLDKLENRFKLLSTMTNEKQLNIDIDNSKDDSDHSSINVIQKQNQILTTQKKLITKRIQFLTNLNIKLKGFYIQSRFVPSVPIEGNTKEIKISGDEFDDLKNKKQQYYFSKKTLNLVVENCTNFLQYLNLKKQIYLKKQNKILFDLLKTNGISHNQIKDEIMQRSGIQTSESKNNNKELITHLKIQKFLKKSMIENLRKFDSNSKTFVEINQRYLKSQQSETDLTAPLSVDSSIIQFLLNTHKLTNFEETLGTLLAIQKRGNALSQKNNYYKKYKLEWNKKKLHTFSKSVFKRLNSQLVIPLSKNGENKDFVSGVSTQKFLNLSSPGIGKLSQIYNFLGVRTWTRDKQNYNEILTPINQKLYGLKENLNSNSVNSLIFENKLTPQHFLSIENFVKESILKPQRFEKQQSRKRLKFKKLSRQENFKNLLFWDNYFKQKEDIKNKLFFDDLSLSFQKWKNFGFFSQKKVFQKQINNFSTKFHSISISRPSSSAFIYKENNKKKFDNFYDTNMQTITNLDIIKQIEYDNFIQKELNICLNNNEFCQININSNYLNNKEKLKIENNKNIDSLEIQKNSNSANDTSSGDNFFDNDIIGQIYEKFFVKPSPTPMDQSQINKTTLIGINPFPFYAGWDESLRKFVITNRLLSRRDAGYNSNIIEQRDSNKFNIEFQQWPLQGRNAATTFFCHFPFITQPSDFSETIRYRNRTQLQHEEISSPPLVEIEKQSEKLNFVNSNAFLEKNQKNSIKRIKKQKQEFRNENRRNITNLVGPNEIQNRRKVIFYPLKWRNLKSNTKKIILKGREFERFNQIQNNLILSNYNKKTKNLFSHFSLLRETEKNYIRPLLSKFHLLRILRKGNTSKIRLTKLRPYKKSTKKENDILESSWRTFLSKRKLRSFNFVRQKNIRTMHLFKSQLGKRLQSTKMQWLFRKNNSRANRQSENRKNKSGAHFLRPRKKSLRRRSLGIKYQRNKQISGLNNLYTKSNLNMMDQIGIDALSQTNLNQNRIKIQNKMMTFAIKRGEITDFSNFTLLKNNLIIQKTIKKNQLNFSETPLNWIRPNYSNNLYNLLFQTPYIYTPTISSTLPGHGRFLPKIQTLPLPKSSVQTIKRAIRLANFEPASFIQREVLSYEWSMKQLIQNMTSRLNHSANRFMLERKNINKNKQNEFHFSSLMSPLSSSFSIDFLLQRHLRLLKKKLINNPIIFSSSNAYLSQFSRQRTFQKRSIRLRKFNMTLAINLYDRWFFYYYTGGKEDPLQNLFKSFGKLAQNISNPNTIQLNSSGVFDNSKVTHLDNVKNNYIFKSIRKFLTQKPDQKRSFNTFLTNLKTKKSSSFYKDNSNQEQKQNIFNSNNLKENYLIDETAKSNLSLSIDEKSDFSNSASLDQWWHLFKLFPETIEGQFAKKEMLAKISSNKKQKKQQEKDLDEDRFYFLKANKSPIIQDFRISKSVNRHYPLNGGFIWPGDYLRLQTIMLPKEKKYKYFYTKNLISEVQKVGKFENRNLKTSKSIIYSNFKINEKIKEFQNFLLESK